MGMKEIAAAMKRTEDVLRRKPSMGLHGAHLPTDMPVELGGTGDQVSPGWLFRAGVASCAATSIAMHAAASGIELTVLEVRASSRTDTRGILGMEGEDGRAVDAVPREMHLHVRIAARGVAPERLRELVQKARSCAPVGRAVEEALPVNIHVDAEAA